jgi:hypothetical protein
MPTYLFALIIGLSNDFSCFLSRMSYALQVAIAAV